MIDVLQDKTKWRLYYYDYLFSLVIFGRSVAEKKAKQNASFRTVSDVFSVFPRSAILKKRGENRANEPIPASAEQENNTIYMIIRCHGYISKSYTTAAIINCTVKYNIPQMDKNIYAPFRRISPLRRCADVVSSAKGDITVSP